MNNLITETDTVEDALQLKQTLVQYLSKVFKVLQKHQVCETAQTTHAIQLDVASYYSTKIGSFNHSTTVWPIKLDQYCTGNSENNLAEALNKTVTLE